MHNFQKKSGDVIDISQNVRIRHISIGMFSFSSFSLKLYIQIVRVSTKSTEFSKIKALNCMETQLMLYQVISSWLNTCKVHTEQLLRKLPQVA